MDVLENLTQNFGGEIEPHFFDFETSRILILPVSTFAGEIGTAAGSGANAIIKASQNLELYDDESDSEVYKLGIHTLAEYVSGASREAISGELLELSKKHLETGKFLFTIGDRDFISAALIKAHSEKFHNLSVVQIDAFADLRDDSNDDYADFSVMKHVAQDMRLPALQIGIRSISAAEARLIDSGLPSKVFRAQDIAGKTKWHSEAIDSLTENVYLTIDTKAFDPAVLMLERIFEPGGLGWFETLTFIRKLARSKRIIGMDVVEIPVGNNPAAAFVCAKLVYKSLSYIFSEETPHVVGFK